MTNEQAKKMLKAKLECLKRETSGTDFDCNRCNCDECSLNYEQGNIGEQKEALTLAIQALEPQAKTGEWIEVEVCNCHATLKCSVCDRVIEPTFTYGEYSYDDIKEWYPYCHCGAKMGGNND